MAAAPYGYGGVGTGAPPMTKGGGAFPGSAFPFEDWYKQLLDLINQQPAPADLSGGYDQMEAMYGDAMKQWNASLEAMMGLQGEQNDLWKVPDRSSKSMYFYGYSPSMGAY